MESDLRSATGRIGRSGRETQATGDDPVEKIARYVGSDLALSEPRADWTGGDASEGKVIYAKYCVLCHGDTGKGDGLGAAALNPKPRDFTTGSFYFDANANGETGEAIDLARIILYSPDDFGGSIAMPAWQNSLSVDDVRNVVAYIRSLSAPSD